MNSRLIAVALLAGAAYMVWQHNQDSPCGPGGCKPPAPVQPGPVLPPPPPPPPLPAPPRPRPKPWGECGGPVGLADPMLFGASVGGPTFSDGAQIDCDLPGSLHRKNTSSKGQGCCVFTSIHHAATWQNVPILQEFPKWVQSKGLTGGGYSGNVKQRIAQKCSEAGVPEPPYLQVENGDLELLKMACKTGRMPGVTYSKSPTGRYGGQKIAHMVNIVAASDQHFVVLDNNYIGENNYEWMTPAEFSKAHSFGGSGGWSVILLGPPPPPAPRAWQ